MPILSGPSIEEKDNRIGQNSMECMRILFQNKVKNRTNITVKNFINFCYILPQKLVDGREFGESASWKNFISRGKCCAFL